MILIYWKWKVWNGLKMFCDYLWLESKVKDDADNVTDFSSYEYIIPSPWINPNHAIYKTWKIYKELDFVYKYLPTKSRIVSITWTDWKSTTTWIIYNILKEEYGENKVFLAGNFDESFAQVVTKILQSWVKNPIIIMEISSFMAYEIKDFKSDYLIFTNFASDHLNWHPDMRDYYLSKARLIDWVKCKALINTQIIKEIKKYGIDYEFKNSRFFGYWDDIKNFGLKDYVELPNIVVSGRKKYDFSKTNFSGIFNALNVLSAVLIANEMWICSKRVTKYLTNISWLSHRIEFYKEINWVKFYDDSKSTSCQSLKAGISSFDGNLVLIAGWMDKWDKFEELDLIAKDKVKFVVLIWQTKDYLSSIFSKSQIPYEFADSMDDAVNKSWKQSLSWDTILLSPGCASMDMFKNYEDRANKFKEAVDKLK